MGAAVMGAPVMGAPVMGAPVMGGRRKQYCPSDLPLRSIPPTPAVWVPPAYGHG